MTLEEQYKKETGQDAICITTDGIHCVGFEVYRFDYVKWLEEKASRESRQLSAVPSDGEVMLKALVDELERWNDMQEDDRIGGRPITGHTYHVLSNAKKFLIKRGIDG